MEKGGGSVPVSVSASLPGLPIDSGATRTRGLFGFNRPIHPLGRLRRWWEE